MWDSLKELYQLMLDIPMYSANFLSIAHDLLQTYVEISQEMFKGGREGGSEGGREGGREGERGREGGGGREKVLCNT